MTPEGLRLGSDSSSEDGAASTLSQSPVRSRFEEILELAKTRPTLELIIGPLGDNTMYVVVGDRIFAVGFDKNGDDYSDKVLGPFGD
jgi:hypothetical protein